MLRAVVCVVCLLAVGCGDVDYNNRHMVLMNEIDGKWEIDSDTYKSLEFNASGNYIAAKTAGAALFGSYTLVGDNAVDIKGVGKVVISHISEQRIEFYLIPEVGVSENVTGTKVAQMLGSNRTDMLCQTWRVAWVNDSRPTPSEELRRIVFTKSATFAIAQGATAKTGGWRWNDEAQTSITCWTDGVENSAEYRVDEIVELTPQKLIVKGLGNDQQQKTLILEMSR